MPVPTYVFETSGNAFFDTRVFYPHARSYQSRSLPSLYKRFESEKKREYGERINTVEHGSFTPLVFSACGGMGHEATVAVRKLASALASKRRETYSRVINWLRCRLSFSLARSAIRLSIVCAALGLSDARVHPAWHQWTWSAPRPTSTCINSKSLYIICCITMHHNCVFQNTKDTPTITSSRGPNGGPSNLCPSYLTTFITIHSSYGCLVKKKYVKDRCDELERSASHFLGPTDHF